MNLDRSGGPTAEDLNLQQGLDPRLMAVVEAVRRHRKRHGLPPTRAEIADTLGCSASTVQRRLDKLVASGVLVRDNRRARGVHLVNER